MSPQVQAGTFDPGRSAEKICSTKDSGSDCPGATARLGNNPKEEWELVSGKGRKRQRKEVDEEPQRCQKREKDPNLDRKPGAAASEIKAASQRETGDQKTGRAGHTWQRAGSGHVQPVLGVAETVDASQGWSNLGWFASL